MNSKTSFFNRTVFHKDCTRLWPVWALYSLILFFALPFQAYLRLPEARGYAGLQDFIGSGAWYSDLAGIQTAISPILICLMALLSANAVFGYLYQGRSSNMMHAFPVSRGELFATHFISGYLFLAVPLAVMFFAALPGYLMQGLKAGEVLPGLVYALGVAFFFFALAVFACMLSGHIVASLAWFAIFNGAYIILRVILHIIVNSFSYGTVREFLPKASGWDVLFPGYYLIDNTGMTYNESLNAKNAVVYFGWRIVLGYAAAAVVLTALSVWLYRRRHLETAGEMNVFGGLNPVVRILAGFCGGGLFGYALATLSSRDGELHLIPFLVFFVLFNFIWYLVSAIILKKSFRVFGKSFWLEWVLLAAVSVALILTLSVKVAGDRESFVPEADKVEAAVISCSYPIYACNADEIGKITDIHRAIIDNKKMNKKLAADYGYSDYTKGLVTNVTINYILRDGTKVERCYELYFDRDLLSDRQSAQACIDRMEADYTQALKYAFSEKCDELEMTGGELVSWYTDDKSSIPAEAAQEVFAAAAQDMAQGHLKYRVCDDVRDPEKTFGTMGLVLYGRADGVSALTSSEFNRACGKHRVMADDQYAMEHYCLTGASPDTSATAPGKYETTYECRISIGKECKNVLAALKKNGIRLPENAFGEDQ